MLHSQYHPTGKPSQHFTSNTKFRSVGYQMSPYPTKPLGWSGYFLRTSLAVQPGQSGYPTSTSPAIPLSQSGYFPSALQAIQLVQSGYFAIIAPAATTRSVRLLADCLTSNIPLGHTLQQVQCLVTPVIENVFLDQSDSRFVSSDRSTVIRTRITSVMLF